MSVFTAGSNGANVLDTVFATNASTITSRTVTSSAVTVYYSDGSHYVLSGNFTVSNGSVSGGTLTGWTSYSAAGGLNWSITGFSADLQTILLDDELGLYTQITNMVFTYGSTYYGSTNPNASDVLIGFGGDTFIGGAATELFEPSAGTNTIRGGTGLNTLKLVGTLSGYSIVNNGNGAFTITDSQSTRNGVDHVSGVQAVDFLDVNASVSSDGKLSLPTASVSQAISYGNPGDLSPIQINDYSSAVVANLTSLQTMAKEGILGAISLKDVGSVTLSLTPSQLSADAGALGAIGTSGVTAKIDASAANLTLAGVSNLADVAVYTGKVAAYGITVNSDGSLTVTDTGTGRASIDHLSNFTALQFSDETVFVAQTPGGSGPTTTGNITELYSAALGRVPDVSGLSFYQNFLKSNPGTALTTFAQFFLSSSEYTGNSAHNYAQTTTGETQFITDLYTNLLHRSPDSGAVPFYLNVITQQLANDTPGTAQYTTDDKAAHALVLTYISQSSEFLSDVQITASNPASAQHWLVLS